MFDKNYRPLSDVISIKCDYRHLPYRFRQKIKKIQGYLLDLRNLSKNRYLRLYLFDDSCFLLDIVNNKILWTYDYSSSLAVIMCHLTEMYRLFSYEKNCCHLKNPFQINDYKSLKKKYYDT